MSSQNWMKGKSAVAPTVENHGFLERFTQNHPYPEVNHPPGAECLETLAPWSQQVAGQANVCLRIHQKSLWKRK